MSMEYNKLESMQVSSASSSEEEQGEVYSEGSLDLLNARKVILSYSATKAKVRLQKESSQQRPIAQIKQWKQKVNERMSNFSLVSSQIQNRPVSCTRFELNGTSNRIAVGEFSGDIAIYDTNSTLLTKLNGHSDRIGSVEWNPMQHSIQLASGSSDSTILLWSLNQSQPISKLIGHALRVARVAFHPSGRYLASSSFDTSWRLWDLEKSQQILLQDGHAREVYGIAFQCDGSLIATGGLEGLGRVWDLRTGQNVMQLNGHSKSIIGLDFHPNGFQVVSGSEDNSIVVTDLRQLKSPLREIPAHSSVVSDVKFCRAEGLRGVGMDVSCEGWVFVSAGFDGNVKIWSAGDWKMVRTLKGHEGRVVSCDVSADGEWIVSGSFDRTFKLWRGMGANE